LASLVLHIPLALVVLTPGPGYRASPPASHNDRVVEVQIRPGPVAAVFEPEPALLPTAAAAAVPDAPEGWGDALPEPVPPATSVPILPLRDLPYIPAGELDVRPYPETPVVVPFPDDAAMQNGKLSVVLVLYIGANGQVDRIEVDKSDLPPAFEKAARDTFMQARMQPGIKDGQATRARMKILVEFEAR
jgi:TonB family protein